MPPKGKSKKSSASPSASAPNTVPTVTVEYILAKVADSIAEKSGRTSGRIPALAHLEKPELRKLIGKILDNSEDTVVLKIKNHMPADINTIQFDAITEALWHNSVCQALYVQNLSEAILENQLLALLNLLKEKTIWCLNIGETYEIPLKRWEEFSNALPDTYVTHLYVSEHVIPIDLKNSMRRHIRLNRTKHNLHCSRRNLAVIERCTNMWWNPLNGVKFPKPTVLCDNPKNVAYWQQGVGEGGNTAWKFHCVPCGEECSSYENWRYHPTGRMFECSQCKIWSHVDCTLGKHYTDEDLEELMDVMCGTCTAKQRRDQRRMRSEPELRVDKQAKRSSDTKGEANVENLEEKDDLIEGKRVEEHLSPKVSAEGSATARQWGGGLLFYVNNGKGGGDTGNSGQKTTTVAEDGEEYYIEVEDNDPWRFKCKCGISCSSEDSPPYYPQGNTFECAACGVWSHVACVLGHDVTVEALEKMTDVKCSACRKKAKKTRVQRLPPPPLLPNEQANKKSKKEESGAASTVGTDLKVAFSVSLEDPDTALSVLEQPPKQIYQCQSPTLLTPHGTEKF